MFVRLIVLIGMILVLGGIVTVPRFLDWLSQLSYMNYLLEDDDDWF
jgi:hypothetical protein